MKKATLEFINACAWCNVYTSLVEGLGEEYRDKVQVKIYKVGKDFEYIRKYGPVMKSILIINEKKKIENVNRDTIKKAFQEAALWFYTL